MRMEALNNKITGSLHSNSDLQSNIENLESIKEFYKTEVGSLKNEIKALNKAHRENLNVLDYKFIKP